MSLGGRVGVNVNCRELAVNFSELIFFNLRIIYGDSRSKTKKQYVVTLFHLNNLYDYRMFSNDHRH